ncbi:MAG: aldo/keto reductase [Syntrophales bacterium]|jgi:predicted aldo/keto reductase-like oxidoreductase
MEKIRLGKTNMMVSRLGFGGIPIQRDSEDEAVAIVKRCLELGITFFDTANAYTTSEARIGKAISGQREGLIIATKTTSRSREGVKDHLELSLKRLDVEYIDLYQFHNVSDFNSLETVLDPEGPMAVVAEAQKSGLVKYIGITSHQIDVAKAAVKTDRFETIMFPFNFITSEASDELLPLCKKHDVGFIAMKPLAGGMLENVSIAFKYLLQFPDVLLIPGIEKLHEIDEIVKALHSPMQLTELEKHEMQRLKEELGTRFCRRCDYCQPCTAEISISLVMQNSSFAKRLPQESMFSGWIAEGLEKAENCTDCGDCEERCPFHLPIREMIKESVKQYREAKKKYQELMAAK